MRWLLLALLVGCGDPLVEQGYRGEPLLSFDGLITDFRFAQTLEELTLSIFWTTSENVTTDVSQLIEQGGVDVQTQFPSTFQIKIFNLPSDEALGAIDRPYLAGHVLVYEDDDDDGKMSQAELIGGAAFAGVLYVREPLDAASSPTQEPLEAGYHRVRLPLPCEDSFPPAVTGLDDCRANLGAPCASDADCTGEAICRTEINNGYCIIGEEADCDPVNGVLGPSQRTDQSGPGDEEPVFFEDWYLACEDDSECRTLEGHSCVYWLQGCYPQGPVSLELGTPFEIANICALVIEGP